jgi:hypothetical protein
VAEAVALNRGRLARSLDERDREVDRPLPRYCRLSGHRRFLQGGVDLVRAHARRQLLPNGPETRANADA